MTTTLRAMAILIAAAVAAVPAQQRADFSGTWTLDAARSRVNDAAGLAGLMPAGAPATLHVTHPANGTLVVESQINEGHVRIYSPHATSSTPIGQGGRIVMTSAWSGGTLVAEGRQETPSGATTMVKQVKETLTLSADGATLTIDVATSGPGAAKHASALVYTRTQEVGSCRNWPTPCKR